MSAINADPAVMEFFPSVQSYEETTAFIKKMQDQLAAKGYCYFAVDKLQEGELIGFVGLSEQKFDAPFTPCVDIGWRLHKDEWNKGFATEGARRWLKYVFQYLNLPEVFAIASWLNAPSEHVMKKIGMEKVMNFQHPNLAGYKHLQDCVLYKITAEKWKAKKFMFRDRINQLL